MRTVMGKRAMVLGVMAGLAGGVCAQEAERFEGEVGRTAMRSLEAGDRHAYVLDLEAGRFVYGEADQRTVDVVVTVFDGEGQKVAEFDGPARGAEAFQFESVSAGTYRIEIAPFEGEEGEYAFTLVRVEPVASTPEGRVEQMVAPYDRPGVPGGVVAVVRDGRVVYSHAFGAANLTHAVPFETDTRTNIGSTSKQFTAFAIALLAERGALSLDDDVREHIPELPDLGETVTLRNLLTHTGGYREFLNTLLMTGRRLDRGDSIDRGELISIVQRQPALQNSPGAEWNYNNTGYGLLTVVVERVSGGAFPEWMRANVFEPLGMHDTFVRSDRAEIIENSAQGYAPAEGGGFRIATDLGGAMGAGGIYTTIEDLALWMDNLGSGEHGGSPVVKAMTTPFVLTSGEPTNYGLGLFLDTQGGLRRVHHGGADTAHRSSFIYFPDLDAGVITQSNNATFPGNIAIEMAGAFFADSMEQSESEPAPETEADAFDPDSFVPGTFDAFVGRYELEEMPGFVMTFSREGSRYFAQATGQPRFEIFPTSAVRFRFEVVDAAVTFHEGEGGEVSSLTVHQNGDHPATRLRDAPWAPDADALGAYTGRYYSQELETFYNVVVDDGSLVLRHRRLDDVKLTPAKEDRFAGGMPIAEAEFVRDDDGRVTGMLASNGRTRGVRFERVGDE